MTPNPADDVAVATEKRARGIYSRYRIMAMITGGMLLLLTLEMVLKYVFQLNGVAESGEPEPVIGTWVAIIHGWIYAVYAVAVFQIWSFMRWSLVRLALLVLGGVIPVLSFVMEARARHWFEAGLPDRVERARRLAAAERG
ncbi:MAG: DUF3817 domain-containing protein [Actinomycetes bacterium]|nr:DUF3817 domain-containing protein [Actinomycetes bacterium]MDX5380279.1 DUF3817 domain-containing protein [Actinomycetes bacterium]MDX5399004.1 DUF3817 domain-containing protein [Actinomycetes bacterium]MDX5450006.1 DUF3817 domain-containing protein [Actinomycetes bacterium]